MKKTVLVIDNDTASSSLISKTLEPEGYLVFSASSGDASITMAKKVTPLLIFLNLATPGTGLEICKSIRNIPALKDTPIVLLTIRESKFDPRYKSLYGIVDFLKKPFTSDDIASKVNSIIAPLAMPEEKEVPPFEPEEPVVSTTWDLPQVEEPQEEAFEDFRVKEPIIKKDMFEETEKEPSAMPEEEKLIIEKPTPPQKPKTEPVKPIKEPDEFFPSETEETAEVFTPISEPVLGKKESTKKKKRLKVSSKSRNIRVPAIAVLVVAVLGFAVYWYLQRKPQVDIGRRPAEVLSTADTASKPLKKPHITIEPEVILADIEAPQIELKGQVPKKPAYYVQFGAFSSEKNANALVLDLKAKAEETFVSKGTSKDGKTIYRVLSSESYSKKSALSKAQAIKEKKIQTTVFEEAPSQVQAKLQIEVKPKPEKPKLEAKPPQAKTVPSKKPAYYVQFGAFSSEKNANALVLDLKAKAEETFVSKGTSKDGKTIYRVLSSESYSKKSALSKAQAIMDTKKIQAVVFFATE